MKPLTTSLLLLALVVINIPAIAEDKITITREEFEAIIRRCALGEIQGVVCPDENGNFTMPPVYISCAEDVHEFCRKLKKKKREK